MKFNLGDCSTLHNHYKTIPKQHWAHRILADANRSRNSHNICHGPREDRVIHCHQHFPIIPWKTSILSKTLQLEWWQELANKIIFLPFWFLFISCYKIQNRPENLPEHYVNKYDKVWFMKNLNQWIYSNITDNSQNATGGKKTQYFNSMFLLLMTLEARK